MPAELAANKGKLGPRHLAYAIVYYSSVDQCYPSLLGALYQSIHYMNGR